jgi:hypothetical protein
MTSLCLKSLRRSIETDELATPRIGEEPNEVRRSCGQRGRPRSDQRTICTAPRASGRPCPLSRPRPFRHPNRALVTDAMELCGSRARLPSEARPASLRYGSECPPIPPLYAYAPLPACRASDRSLVRRHSPVSTRFFGEHVCEREPF